MPNARAAVALLIPLLLFFAAGTRAVSDEPAFQAEVHPMTSVGESGVRTGDAAYAACAAVKSFPADVFRRGP